MKDTVMGIGNAKINKAVLRLQTIPTNYDTVSSAWMELC